MNNLEAHSLAIQRRDSCVTAPATGAPSVHQMLHHVLPDFIRFAEKEHSRHIEADGGTPRLVQNFGNI